jgi:hypothetical protein
MKWDAKQKLVESPAKITITNGWEYFWKKCFSSSLLSLVECWPSTCCCCCIRGLSRKKCLKPSRNTSLSLVIVLYQNGTRITPNWAHVSAVPRNRAMEKISLVSLIRFVLFFQFLLSEQGSTHKEYNTKSFTESSSNRVKHTTKSSRNKKDVNLTSARKLFVSLSLQSFFWEDWRMIAFEGFASSVLFGHWETIGRR